MADGAGRNSGLTQPALPASCQNAITNASAIQPEVRPALGVKPAPRKATGRALVSSGVPCCARSSMLDLPFGVDRLLADQRPQIVLQAEQFFARPDIAAL